MSEKIDKTLKKIAENTQTGDTTSGDELPEELSGAPLPGDPHCPICKGIGFVRKDHPLGHPDFGKMQICSCRKVEISSKVHERLFALSNLDALQHLTFDNFKPRGGFGSLPADADSIELAYNQARIFASNLDGWLLLQGSYGCGKTHLAAAIANYTVEIGVPTLFITVPDLLDALRRSYSDPESTYEKRFEEIRRAPLLIMDDFGTQNATEWAQEKLFQIVNFRYINRLATVVTTNLLLSDIEERIRSRLIDPELVTRVNISAPDYRNPSADFGQHAISIHINTPELTFETFSLRKDEGLPKSELATLQRAFQAAKEFAEEPRGWLILMGTYGSGKTHLAMAIANHISQHSKAPTAISIPRMLNYLRATFNTKTSDTLERRFEEIISTPVLILDDLGTQSMTPWVYEQLFQIFDERYRRKLPTVITTSKHLEDMDRRLVSRMKDPRLCKICTIDVPGYFDNIHSKSGRAGRKGTARDRDTEYL
jgi:DNA replication protein DnaC